MVIRTSTEIEWFVARDIPSLQKFVDNNLLELSAKFLYLVIKNL